MYTTKKLISGSIDDSRFLKVNKTKIYLNSSLLLGNTDIFRNTICPRHDIAAIILILASNTNQSNNKSISLICTFLSNCLNIPPPLLLSFILEFDVYFDDVVCV